MTVAAVAHRHLGTVRAAGRRHLGLLDVAVAAMLSLGGLAEVANLTYTAPPALAVVSCVTCTGSVAVRRRAPFAVAVVVTTALTVYQIATNDPDGSFIAPAVVLVYYFAGRAAAQRPAWTWLAVVLGYALVADIVIEASTGPFSLLRAAALWPLTLVPAAGGIVVARHGCLLRRLAEATASLCDEQRVRSKRLLSEERNRVARELHDVVAHHVSVMVIQAGAARLVAASEPAAADTALQVVEGSGRGALAELRRIIGAIRRGDTPDADTSIGLAYLAQIVDRTRASGVCVDVAVSGELGRVPSAVDLVAYRVVQEALTNVVKHARPATASVAISVGLRAIDVNVTDTGAGSGSTVLPGAGHGLLGMRERVALYGGQLTSGRRFGGGFEVRATIPLRSEPLDQSDLGVPVTGSDRSRPRWHTTANRWLSLAKPWSDVVLAGGWLVALEVDAFTDHYRRGPIALNVIVVAALAIAFIWRRKVPLLFLLVVGLGAISLSSGLTSPHATLVGFYCVTVPTFTIAAWQTRTWAVTGLALWIAGAIGVGLIEHKPAAGVAGGLIMSCLLWAAGLLWRSQRLIAERLAQTHLLLAAERDDRERLAIASERARIARELHTAVAQGVVAMIVQATAARGVIRSDPAAALAALSSIEQGGREALARMRAILGVLRARQDPSIVRPQPGIGQLHAMIQQLRDCGRTVQLSIEGDPGPLPVGVDLSAYRIIEAALAEADPRPSCRVTVTVRFADDRVLVEVTGSGLQLSARLKLIVGERAALCNGTVLLAAKADRGPRLLVQLPFTVSEAVPV
jgi:signal transduction histidine kinase